MALKQELTEPWGLLLGATAAGTAWAVGLPAAAAGAVGAVVWATKAVSAALERRRPSQLGSQGTLPVDARSAESVWLQRSDQATAGFAELAGSMSTGPLADRVAMMQPEVADTVHREFLTSRTVYGNSSWSGSTGTRARSASAP